MKTKNKAPVGMDLTNLCYHPIWIRTNGGVIEIPPSKIVARIAPKKSVKFHTVEYNGHKIHIQKEDVVETHVKGGGLHGAILQHHRFPLPHPKIGHFYIVSKITALYNPDRDDLVVPDISKEKTTQDNPISRLYIPAKVVIK